ncbi:MAG: helix-turn-helix domain-containing protein, partial [Clostridia bacterium]|nr:helix-turn-helix domain-containing protein [Clostridia bacterium]
MEYGEKIIALRKSRGMTQTELGNALNVTFQAVSKWERGESYPDFETLSKIAKLFGVPITYFEDGNESAPASAQPAAKAPPAILGMCTSCGRVIHEGEECVTKPALVCKECADRRAREKQKAAQDAQQNQINRERYRTQSLKHKRNKGLIVSGIINAALLLLVIVGLIIDPVDIVETLLGYCIIVLFLFPFIAQLFWGGFIVDVCLAGGKMIGGIGVIFTLDLDGVIFLIVFKLLFFVLRLIIFFLTLIFFVIV